MSKSKATAADVGPNARGQLGAAAEWLPLDALTPHPKNPRVHGPEVTRLARTILRTAWGAPIVAQWRASGRHRVIAGHGRLLAAREILAGVEVDGELRGGAEHLFDASAPGPGLLPVRVVRVSDAEADAMTLADNARAIQGEDSAELVAEMAAQFGRDAAVMSDIGFDGAALDALIKGAGDAILGGAGGSDDIERHEVIGDDARERIEVEEDEAPVDRAEELRAKWNTAAGQLWEIPSATVAGGAHRILCGDSTKAEDVARVMGGERANAVVTDPPYGINQPGVPNDEPEKLAAIVEGAVRALPVTDAAVVAFQSTRTFPMWLDATRRAGLAFERMLWLYKSAQCTYPWRGWILKSEAILVSSVGSPRWNEVDPFSHDCYALASVNGELPPNSGWHGSIKPIKVVADIVARDACEGDSVYEPFSGSGTTIVAAEQTGRLCRAIEIAPQYVAVALERLSALGLMPRLVS